MSLDLLSARVLLCATFLPPALGPGSHFDASVGVVSDVTTASLAQHELGRAVMPLGDPLHPAKHLDRLGPLNQPR